MLIEFSLENWMSFRDRVGFSMVAVEPQNKGPHWDRLPNLAVYDNTRILPVAAIYGGNASGKSNFFAALKFAKDLVVKGISPGKPAIPVVPFALGPKGETRPSNFAFTLLADEHVYQFDFTLTRQQVLEEKLVKIVDADKALLYERHGQDFKFGPSLARPDLVKLASEGTREKQLFLYRAVDLNVEDVQPVFDWFKDTLQLIGAGAGVGTLEPFLNQQHPRYSEVHEILSELDTGIVRLEMENIETMMARQVASGAIGGGVLGVGGGVLGAIGGGIAGLLLGGPIGAALGRAAGGVVETKAGELGSAHQILVAAHTAEDGREVLFTIDQESDGTQRVIGLLPSFIDLVLGSSRKVYVIDELDRSLHTMLSRKLLEMYLDSCSAESRAQLLLTTHDVLLVDKALFRCDEMWVTERDSTGATSLSAFSDYKQAFQDKDIRESYLKGRLGGIPRILPETI